MFFLLYFLIVLRGHLTLDTSANIIRLKNYGFHPNGIFRVNVSLSKLSTIHFFLTNSKEFSRIKNDPLLFSKACTEMNAPISSLNITLRNSTSFFSWEVHILSSDIYTPLLIRCSDQLVLHYDITYFFQNPNSYLDSRDEEVPSTLITMSFIYDILTFIWFLSIFFYPSFSISYTFFLSILSPIKSISLVFRASTLTNQGYSDSISNLQFFYTHIINFVLIFLLTLLILLGCDGYGVFYESINYRKLCQRSIIPIGLSLTFSLFGIFDVWLLLPFLLLPAIIFLFLYLESLLQFTNHLLDLLANIDDDITINKYTLVYNFSLSSQIFILIWLSFQSFAVLTHMSNSYTVFISELIEFSFYVLLMFHFIFRDSFKGEFTKREEINLCALEDPISHDIIITQQGSIIFPFLSD